MRYRIIYAFQGVSDVHAAPVAQFCTYPSGGPVQELTYTSCEGIIQVDLVYPLFPAGVITAFLQGAPPGQYCERDSNPTSSLDNTQICSVDTTSLVIPLLVYILRDTQF